MLPDLASIRDIANAAERIVRFIRGINYSTFMADDEKQSAVFGQVVILGEAANRVSKEFRDACPEIPWHKMIGMRNRVFHGYDEIDWEIVWETAEKDMPDLLILLEPRLPPDEPLS